MQRYRNMNTYQQNFMLLGGKINIFYDTCLYSGHCKQLAPEYAKAAKRLGQKNPPLFIAKVDATANTQLA